MLRVGDEPLQFGVIPFQCLSFPHPCGHDYRCWRSQGNKKLRGEKANRLTWQAESSSLLVSGLTTTTKDAEDLDVVAANCRYDGSSVIYQQTH
jgi:hypothetical protein